MSKLTIFIAEDHETVREGLKLIVNAQPDMEVIGEASDGKRAVNMAMHLVPDVMLMDVSMPRMNGLEATKKLKECCPNTHVLALTRHSDDGYLQQMLRAGASGYVLKQSPPTEMLHAIRSVAAGGKYLDPSVAQKVIGRYTSPHQSSFNDVIADLSERESEVLRMIAWGHSNKEIASHLAISVKTVEVHKANGMRKLGMRSRIDIVRYAVLQGWLQEA